MASDIAAMMSIRLFTVVAFANALLFWLFSCSTSSSVKQLSHAPPTTVLPDSVVHRPYRLLLDQLATADWQDRKAIFKVFRLRGFGSPAADSANRWLLRQDSTRLQAFQTAERRYGWPRASRVGKDAVQQAYLLVQHAPAAVHASYQDTLRAAYARGELLSMDYATYLDRVLLYKGQLQRYGTQSGRRVLAKGQEEDYLLPVEDLPELDHRRATMKLEPILTRLQPGTLILKPAGK